MKPRSLARGLTAPLALMTCLTVPAAAQDDIRALGANRAWHGFMSGSGEETVCYMVSEPESSRGNYDNRGSVFAVVSRHRADFADAVVSFEMGYDLAPDSEVRVSVDQQNAFTLVADGGRAWSPDAATDAAMVTAMRAGYEMVVEGVSAGGTATTDSYSLLGFTATLQAIEEGCAGEP